MNLFAHKFLSVLLILAFLTAGISPACAFISGKTSLIEICASDGSLKTIEVSYNQAVDIEESNGGSKHQTKKNDCAFCFANTNITKMVAKLSAINFKPVGGFIYTNSSYFAFKPTAQNYFQSRAPPALV